MHDKIGVSCKASQILGPAWTAQPEFRMAVENSARKLEHDLLGLQLCSHDRDRRRKKTYRVLSSYSGRLCALIMAWPKKLACPGANALMQMAAEFSPYHSTGEEVHIYAKQKDDGSFRPIASFGPLRRAQQKLVAWVLDAIWGTMPQDYMRRGRGRDAAFKVLADTIRKGGSSWVLTADIKSYYPSINKEKLINLIPLPKSVIQNTLLVNDPQNVTIDPILASTSCNAVLSGLPQGSLASPIVAAFLLQQVAEQIDGNCVLFHGDDIAAAFRTEEEAKANMQKLGGLLEDHPAGPLFMKSEIAQLGQPIDALGYRLKRRAKCYGGGVKVIPNQKSFKRYEQRAYARLVKIKCPRKRDGEAEKYQRHWYNSFRLWIKSEHSWERLQFTTINVASAVSKSLNCKT